MNNIVFKNQLNKLLSFDSIRIFKIIEIIQYSIIFIFLSIFCSYFLNNFIFYEIDKEDYKKIPTYKLLLFLILDILIILIIYFYMKKLAYLVPSIGHIFYNKFEPFTTFEYVLDIPGLYLFLELTDGLKGKIEELSRRITNRNNGFLL
tara:strand:- start:8 stop:451 length:444 start_codon:yes stop_codon:yes gene_type:complete